MFFLLSLCTRVAKPNYPQAMRSHCPLCSGFLPGARLMYKKVRVVSWVMRPDTLVSLKWRFLIGCKLELNFVVFLWLFGCFSVANSYMKCL